MVHEYIQTYRHTHAKVGVHMYQCEIVFFAGFDFIFDNFGANALGSLSHTLSLSLPHTAACALFIDAVRMTHAMMICV